MTPAAQGHPPFSLLVRRVFAKLPSSLTMRLFVQFPERSGIGSDPSRLGLALGLLMQKAPAGLVRALADITERPDRRWHFDPY